jgi:hypothetical protein
LEFGVEEACLLACKKEEKINILTLNAALQIQPLLFSSAKYVCVKILEGLVIFQLL